MKYKTLICGLAFTFSILFSFIYLFIFGIYNPKYQNDEKVTLYMNQIGLYKEIENAQNVKKNLEEKQIRAYIYKNEDLYVVVCGLGSEEEAHNNGETLKNLSYSHILKKVEISDPKMITYVKNEDFEKALELMEHQSQGNGGE